MLEVTHLLRHLEGQIHLLLFSSVYFKMADCDSALSEFAQIMHFPKQNSENIFLAQEISNYCRPILMRCCPQFCNDFGAFPKGTTTLISLHF